MLFPDVKRVIYKKNPLIEVICQFRFPTLLRIEQTSPADFQEAIREEYPIFREKTNFIPQEVANALSSEVASALGKNRTAYEFASEDENWSVSLTRDFLALTTKEYTRWEEFLEKIKLPLDALNDIYKPTFYSRIGLRYQDIICRSELALQNTAWSELVNPALAGFFQEERLASAVENDTKSTVLRLEDNLGKVRIRYGTVIREDNDETCFKIDSDFFIEEKRSSENGYSVIKEFNRRNRNLFRWCITDKLHYAMEPQNL